MRAFIKKNLKQLLSVTILLVCSAMLIGTNEILAQVVPNLSDVALVSYELRKSNWAYTGEELTPEVTRIVLEDADAKRVVKFEKDIQIIKYNDNVECGSGSVEIAIDGYRGTLILQNAFHIKPAQVTGVQVIQENRESIHISWKEVYGADGYYIYKSNDSGATYSLLVDLPANDVFTYEDTDVQLNASYMYYVSAYISEDKDVHEGKASESAIQYTPLETAVLASVKNTAYNTNQVQWNAVPGAAGYQIYRATDPNSEYTCIAELTDGAVTTYSDATCECGITYYYYVKACQLVNAETIYGDASNVLSVRTAPNRVGLNGSTTDDSTKVNLSWSKSTGAQGYQIYCSVNSSSNFSLVATIESADTLSWSQSGLDKHTSYFYRIRPYRIEKGTTVTGSYSGTYQKAAVIIYDYSGGTGADVLRQYVGRPYVYGGSSPTYGWDCSYFVKWTFATHFGIELPRTTSQQVNYGISVSLNDRSSWKPGDLIFYKEAGVVSHVAVYLGNGQMIHALSSKWDTLIQDVDYYETWDRKTSIYCVKRIFQ